jgi:hypothetical protein
VAGDELAGRYSAAAANAVTRAIRASRYGASVAVYVSSPRAEFRRLDRGGRTRHERAFTRACYEIVFDGPAARGEQSPWSLKLTWRSQADPGAPGRLSRAVALRIFPRDQARVPAGRSWVLDQGAGRSTPATRM